MSRDGHPAVPVTAWSGGLLGEGGEAAVAGDAGALAEISLKLREFLEDRSQFAETLFAVWRI